MQKLNVRQIVLEILSENFSVDIELLKRSPELSSYCWDSIHFLNVFMKLELAFDTKLDLQKFNGLTTINELVNLIENTE